MLTTRNYEIESEIHRLAENIIIGFKSFGVAFDFEKIEYSNGKFYFQIKLNIGTRVDDIKKNEKNVRMLLRIPVFEVYQEDFNIYIVVALQETSKNNLLTFLKHPQYLIETNEMRVPYVIGVDFRDIPVIVDIPKLPNLIIGGAGTSGKSVALKCLLLSIMWSCSPDKVKILIIDAGAADLTVFNDYCTVIDTFNTSLNTIINLKNIMEKRIALKRINLAEFEKLPYLVVAIDEYPALVSGTKDLNSLTTAMLNLLQRCRHANMSIVLTAQNPTKENLNLDLGSVSARIALRCVKGSNSRTILDENGAENLTAQW